MSKKNKPDSRGFVFSTDPHFNFEETPIEDSETLLPNHQKLIIRIDTKQRAGKAVRLVTGFIGKLADLEILGKQLKNFCGTGGTVKNGEIIIQGDQREKLFQWLLNSGYSGTKKI